jgi:hypothetical protein
MLMIKLNLTQAYLVVCTTTLSPSQQVWLPSAGSWFKGAYMNCLSPSNPWAMSGSAIVAALPVAL